VPALLALALLVGGLHGVVSRGPIAPVCREGEPCSAPVQATLVFRRPGHVYRARSHADGSYRILLPPGYYTVTTLERIGISHIVRPRMVHVRARHVDRLDFSIDTGIR
jgi:hypothetical protein